MVLTLYKKDTSPPCRSVFMTIHALNIPDVKFVNVHIPAGEHLTVEFIKMNPQHTIPLLRDGEFLLWDRSIVEHKMVLTLYKKDTSPPCRSVFMTIHALNIPDVKFVNVHIPAGEHLTVEFIKMNPQHTIPLLRDGEFLLWDSHAICGYLVSTYGDTDSLYPKDPKKRAVVDQRLHFDSGVPTVVPILYGDDKDFKPENLAKFKEAYGFMEKFLTKTWLAGDDLTIADTCCVSTISSMNEILPIEAKGYPKLTAWLEKCSEQEFYKKWNAPNILLFREMIKNKLTEKQSKLISVKV